MKSILSFIFGKSQEIDLERSDICNLVDSKIIQFSQMGENIGTENLIERINEANRLFELHTSNKEKDTVIGNIFTVLGKAEGGCSITSRFCSKSYEEDFFVVNNRTLDLIRVVWEFNCHDWLVAYYSMSQNRFVKTFTNIDHN